MSLKDQHLNQEEAVIPPILSSLRSRNRHRIVSKHLPHLRAFVNLRFPRFTFPVLFKLQMFEEYASMSENTPLFDDVGRNDIPETTTRSEMERELKAGIPNK